MPRYKSHVTWFNDERFLGSKVTFPDCSTATWKLERKLIEHENLTEEHEAQIPGWASEARAIFVCSSVKGSSRMEAILRIRMQVPYTCTDRKPLSERAKQATEVLSFAATSELEALKLLTAAHCSSAPTLLAFKQEKQDWDSWVPGGYLVYTLMEKLPGTTVSEIYWYSDPEERAEVRRAFKEAWMEVYSCGIFHGDPAARNLLWDKDSKICYLVDFEQWWRPEREKRKGWHNDYYVWFHLAEVGEDSQSDDMSTWIL